MKLFIKRQIVATTVTDPNAVIQLSPVTVLKALAHHPVRYGPGPPVMANYTALGASGGTLVAGAQLGIKLARNGAYLPFTLDYYRITMGARIKGNDQDLTCMVGDMRSQLFSIYPGGVPLMPGEPFPNSEPGSQGRVYTPQEKLIYAANASKTVVASQVDEQAQGLWPLLSSSNGFPSANGMYRASTTIEPSWQQFAQWMIDNAKNAAIAGSASFESSGTLCEYYQITIDDTLIANISSLANDVFVSIPSSFGYTAPYTMGGYVMDVPATVGVQQKPVYVENELVMPLSWILSQTAQQLPATKNVNGNTSPIRPPFGAAAPFNFDITYNHIATVTTSAAQEIALLDPIPFTGTPGPY